MFAIIRYVVYISLFSIFGYWSLQAFDKLINYTVSSKIEYRYGDDNLGNFNFPSVSICPGNFQSLLPNCKSTSFIDAITECIDVYGSLEEMTQNIKFDMTELVAFIIIGDIRMSKANLTELWLPTLNYDTGVCYTFDAKKMGFMPFSLPDLPGGYALDAHIALNVEKLNWTFARVVLHENVEDLPNVKAGKNSVLVKIKDKRGIKFSKRSVSMVPTPKKPCIDEPHFGTKTCKMAKAEELLIRNYGCKLPWMTATAGSANTSLCRGDILTKVAAKFKCYMSAKSELQRYCTPEVGPERPEICSKLHKCQHTMLSFIEAELKNGLGNFGYLKIELDNDYVVYVEDFYSYDNQSFIGEVGGTLGLLLGISMASIFEFINILRQRLVNWIRKNPSSALSDQK